jgi:hypothetical protein
MSKRSGYVGLSIALACTLATLPAPNAYAEQQPAAPSAAGQAPAPAAESSIPAEQAERKPILERYNDGIVIWQTPDDAQVPFMLKFNLNTQVRYLNTTDSEETYTDHLGVVRDVHTRNDITVNRTMFILGGYIFDPRLRYSSTVWTSAGAASIIVAGTIGWQFSPGLTVTGGYTGVPGSRSLVNTFPFFAGADRSMSDNLFRPGFTQGIWASGEPVKGLNYLAFVGNGLNTLNISATKIDSNLMYSGSVWWEPLGDYGQPGKSRHMYDDYFQSEDTRIRLGTSFTTSKEDRFSNLDQSSPENTSMHTRRRAHVLDGEFAWEGSRSPLTTCGRSIGGVKRRACDQRPLLPPHPRLRSRRPLPPTLQRPWLRAAVAISSSPESSRSMAVAARSMASSAIRGVRRRRQVALRQTERMWLNAELMRVEKAPYSGTFTPYTSGLTGWVPMVQAILAF